MTTTYQIATTTLLRYDLGRPVGGSGVTSIDVLVVDLKDSADNRGLGFSYALDGGGTVMLAAANHLLEQFVRDQKVIGPSALCQRMRKSLNRIGRGIHYLAIAAIDVAAWDLHANSLGVPLGVALGGVMRRVPVYGSAGFRPNMDADELIERSRLYVDRHQCQAIKLRANGTATDITNIAAVRDAIPANVGIMVDLNEKCDLAQAKWFATACKPFNLSWLEEPLPSYDFDAYAQLAQSTDIPLACGEHLQGRIEFAPYLKAGHVAIAQPDLAMAGGITESLRIAQMAVACNIKLSPHFLPALFIHLAAVVPGLSWLEHFPLLESLFDNPVDIDATGNLNARETPGHGIRFLDGARAEYQVR